MDSADFKIGTESQDSGSPASVGAGSGTFTFDKMSLVLPDSPSPTMSPKTSLTSKGVVNAKKKLRAFSIQKKTAITPVTVPKPISSGNTTVIIGKLNSVKVTPKVTVEDPAGEQKRPPKPPKPGNRNIQDYMDQQKKTLAEIEDMKRKMELVDLGIPLGLIGPSSENDKAMPTKAMPPIKNFLDSSKLDQIIMEAKKAKAEGRKFKFDYNRALPGYDNPFQRNTDRKPSERDNKSKNRRMGQYGVRRSHKKDDKSRRRIDVREKKMENKYQEKKQDRKEQELKKEKIIQESKETDVNLSDYLVCDSWSLDNEDKVVSSPKLADSAKSKGTPSAREKTSVEKIEELKNVETISMVRKLKPVIDSFEYEIAPNDDEALDMFDDSASLKKYTKPVTKKPELYRSPNIYKLYDDNTASKDGSDVNDDKFLQSVINEIKDDDICDARSYDKGLVEYEESPKESQSDTRGSVTPELKSLNSSGLSDYSDSFKSVESGYKSTESSYKSKESCYKSNVNDENQFRILLDRDIQGNVSKSTMNSLETWSFVLKICQPLLFRHDKNKCYKETRTLPKLWFTENPRRCNCIKDRSVVYDELETYKMNLVDRVYGCDQIPDAPFAISRTWYPPSEQSTAKPTSNDDWELDESLEPKRKDRRSTTPQRSEEIYLDREYQKFMQALTDASENKADNSRSTTPITTDAKEENVEEKRKVKKRLSSEGWSQESDLEEDVEKSKKMKIEKKQRKRKHSTSTSSVTTSSDEQIKKKKKSTKKKERKRSKTLKNRRLRKKYRKELREKRIKKKKRMKLQETDLEDDYDEKENRRKDKKSKKKKLQKLKRRKQKKKKSKAQSSSSYETSSTGDTSSTETDSEMEKKSKRTKKIVGENKKKKREESTSESQSEELFDVNILNNIKTERITDDEKQISPRKKPREIINVKELQNDFVGNNIHIKKEVEDKVIEESKNNLADNEHIQNNNLECENREEMNEELDKNVEIKNNIETESNEEQKEVEEEEAVHFLSIDEIKKIKMPDDGNEQDLNQEQENYAAQPTTHLQIIDDTSQCSSQDSTSKEVYEKDETHLVPSSQNSSYNFPDIAVDQIPFPKELDSEEKFHEGYEQEHYEMYEQMAYHNEVDDNQEKGDDGERRIETVVRARARGEIKCDWRAGDRPLLTQHRPSRWGLKPGDVNIVLTGGNNTSEQFQAESEPEKPQVYKIQSLANRSENISISYDEAYMDTYGALDRLQYGDCFADEALAESEKPTLTTRSLDERISQALQDSVLSELPMDMEDTEGIKDETDKGILVTRPIVGSESVRVSKRVSFADGYKPGQDSDVEEPPVKKKRRPRRVGCAWPCPLSHPDHVPLWDALPPPPPPPGSPPQNYNQTRLLAKYDPSLPIPNFMPPEPPPGILTF